MQEVKKEFNETSNCKESKGDDDGRGDHYYNIRVLGN